MRNNSFDEVVQKCVSLCKEYIAEGIRRSALIEDIDPDDVANREEFGINSRYLPLGFYCPSRIIEHYITNMRRGKIAQRKVKKPTNRYLFDKTGKLFYEESIDPDPWKPDRCRYVFYKDNTVFAISDEDYKDIGVSHDIVIAIYDNARIQSFLWTPFNFYKKDEMWEASGIYYETYTYHEDATMDVSVYRIHQVFDLKKWCTIKDVADVDYVRFKFYINCDGNIEPEKQETIESIRKNAKGSLTFSVDLGNKI